MSTLKSSWRRDPFEKPDERRVLNLYGHIVTFPATPTYFSKKSPLGSRLMWIKASSAHARPHIEKETECVEGGYVKDENEDISVIV